MADSELETETDCSDLEDLPDTDNEDATCPKKLRLDSSSSRKFSGASVYKSKFKMSWQKKWSCIKPAKNNPNAFYCDVCCKNVSCSHQGGRDVTRHIASAQHQRNAKSIKNTTSLFNFAAQNSKKKDKVHVYM